MFDRNDPRVKENLAKLRKKLKDNRSTLDVYFIATEKLKGLLIAGTHPMIQGMPKSYVEVLVSGQGLRMTTGMVYKWLSGNLDAKNTFVLDNSEIRVAGEGMLKSITEVLESPGIKVKENTE
jgi:hypothetical protein